MRPRAVVYLLILAMVLAVCGGAVLSGTAMAAPGWSPPETAMTGSQHSDSEPSIAIDTGGNRHVAFRDRDSQIRYTNDVAGPWSTPVVVSGGYSNCNRPSVAVDSGGVIHIAYDREGQEIHYVKNSAGWSPPVTVSTGDFNCYGPSLDVDSFSNVHVAYSGNKPPVIRYVNNAGGPWSPPVTICGGDTNCQEPTLDVDITNSVHVAYSGNGSPYVIRYVNNAGGPWSPPVTICGGDTDCFQPSLKTDSGNFARVAYRWSGQIRYVDNTAGWSAPVPISSGDWGCDNPSLALDSLNRVHVAYSGIGWPPEIRYVNNAGGPWSAPVTASRPGHNSYEPSMACAGTICHLTYRAQSMVYGSSDVMYTNNTASWTAPVNISSPGKPPQNERVVLAYDSSGVAHLAVGGFFDGSDVVFYTNNSGGSWSAPVPVSANDPGCTDPSIDVDSSSRVHVVYRSRIAGNDVIRYVDNATGSWTAPVTISGPDNGCNMPSISVDSGNTAHVAYSWGGRISYVENSAGWSAPLTISLGDGNCQAPSLDTDSGNAAHVTYTGNVGSDVIRYVEKGAGWSAPVTVSGGDNGCYDSSLAVGANNVVHVAYRWSSGPNPIRYSNRDVGWSAPQTISGTDNNCQDPSLGVNSNGAAYIGYRGNDGSGDRIRANNNLGGGWDVEPPISVSDSDSGVSSPSLSMNPNYQRPGVTYRSDSNIRYTRQNPPPPSVTNVDTDNGELGMTVSVAIDGSGFRPGATARLKKSGQPEVSATDMQVESFTELNCKFPIPQGAAIGAWDLVVENDDSQSYTLFNGFTIEYATPTVESVTPNSAQPGQIVNNVEITGSGFRPGPMVTLWDGGSVIVVATDVNVVSATKTNCCLELPKDIEAGAWNVMAMTTDNGKMGMLIGGFTVNPPSPAITQVYPSSGMRGETLDVEIDGENTNFSDGVGGHSAGAGGTSRATFSGEGITVNSTEVISPTRVKANITVAPNAPTGARDVNVVTGDETPEALTGSFTIIEQACTWYMAEGSTGRDFETWVAVLNPGEGDATVAVTYLTEEGEVTGPTMVLDSKARATINVAASVPNTWSVSTLVRSDEAVVCERTVYWNNKTSGHSSIGTTAPSDTWYLAEGSTGPGFETWIVLMNPGDEIAGATLTYLTVAGEITGPTLELDPGTRRTVNVADTVPDVWSVSTVVRSDEPVVCERSTYIGGRVAAHSSIGATGTSKLWYLTEGSTADGFETWVLVENPGGDPATVELTYLTDAGPVQGPTVELDPGTRRTVDVADKLPGISNVSTVVVSDRPIIAERATYWGQRTGAHSSIGASSLLYNWYVPEGSTGGGFETWILVTNPSAWDVTARVTFMTERGPVEGPTLQLRPWTRRTVNASQYVPGSFSVATAVAADSPVACERASYWGNRTGGSSSVGYGE